MGKRNKKSKPLAPFVVDDLCAWLDGYNSAFEDFSDGAWFAACKGGVDAFNKEFSTNIDPHDGVHIWLNNRNKG